jgi:hypothetical protein
MRDISLSRSKSVDQASRGLERILDGVISVTRATTCHAPATDAGVSGDQNRPSIWPFAFMRILLADGTLGKPGMVMLSPAPNGRAEVMPSAVTPAAV